MTRVLVCGGRWFADPFVMAQEMGKLHRMFNFTAVIHGAARGADSLAGQWARNNRVPEIACPADWNGPLGKGAGFARNQSMLVDHRPDICVAFPGQRGTADMVRRCERAGVPVFKIYEYAHAKVG
jgi:Protein of unknown function (DUF2493).